MDLGRRAAAEGTYGASLSMVPSAGVVTMVSLLAAVILGGYYAHAHTRAKPSNAGLHGAEPDDKPLPPLMTLSPDRAAKPATRAGAFLIGNILEGDPDPAPGTDDFGAEDNQVPGVVRAMGPSAVSPARNLEGAVFVHADRPGGNGATLPESAAPNIPVSARDAGPDNPLAHMLRADPTPTVLAGALPTQRLLLPKGAFLDCSLETAIDSSLPGLTTCVTALDTFSADGTVVLLERGTKLIGEMRSQVQQGMARVFVLWTEARTPKGVVVALASPGTDELGRSGLPGTVDRHFVDRFGAAILVSVINGAIQGAVNRSQQAGGTVILNPTGIGDVATEILRSTLSIPPTVRVPAGDRIQVLVARDLDFRSVYALRPR